MPATPHPTSKRRSRRRLRALATTVMVLAVLAGSCGEDSGEETAAAVDRADSSTTTTSAGEDASAEEPTVITAAGDIAPAVDEFRDLLGPDNGGGPETRAVGRREIDWDGVPDELARPNGYPPDFFNDTVEPRARGFVIESPSGDLGVSAAADNPDGAPVRFGDLNTTYADEFRTFSEERLFSPIGSNVAEATFFVPGTDTSAAVRGFGAVYTDVDQAESADFELFGADGSSLGVFDVPVAEDGLSFLGIAFEEPVVARVRIVYGNSPLGPDDGDAYDVAVMDDFIYGEPQPLDQQPVAPASSGADALLDQLASATSDAQHGRPSVHVGAVDGSDALVAVAQADDGSVVAYVCDGKEVATWFRGTVDGTSAVLTGPDGRGTLAIDTIDGPEVAGSVTLDGDEHPFTARAVEPAGDALLRLVGDDGRSVTGWILHGDTLRGATKQGKEVAATASIDDVGAIDDSDVPSAGDDPAARRLFPKLQCRKKAKAVIQTPATSPAWNEALEDFISTGCSVESFMPGANVDSTENLCTLYGVGEGCGTIR